MPQDLEAALTKVMHESNALAAVLLKEEQIFTSNESNFTLDPAALLAMASISESDDTSELEIHLLSIESNAKKPVLALFRRLNADECLMLAFSSEKSLIEAEQSFSTAMDLFLLPTQPQPVLLDFSKLHLRQVGSHQEPTWQDELFAMNISPVGVSKQSGSSSDEARKINSVLLPSEKPYWYQVF